MFKLLLVDDELIIREGLQRMIDWERLGITLTASCSNAIAALDSMMDDMPDILVTDVRMPGMNGLELVERAMALHPQLQSIILSGYDTFEYARQALKSGVCEYLLKPCSQEEMEEALKRACRCVDRQRKRVLHLSDERQERIHGLVKRLSGLRESTPAQMERQVHEIVRTAEDPGILREALVFLVTRGMGGGQAEWGMALISDAFREPGNPRAVEGAILRCLHHMHREAEGTQGFVGQMTAYVDAHFAEDSLSLQYLADHVVYMNADYIGREFTRAMGRKFSSYLLEVRMEHAKMLMATQPGLHSYEIAERVGLGNNPHYFSQVFRKYTGMPPKDYRAGLAGGRKNREERREGRQNR